MTKEYNDHLIWLKNELLKIEDKFERRSDLYKLLKTELSRLGYWHNKPRGNPSKGYRQSPVAQQTSKIRQQLKETSTKQHSNDFD